MLAMTTMYQDNSVEVPNIHFMKVCSPVLELLNRANNYAHKLTGIQVYKPTLNGDAFLQFILTNGP